MKTINNNSGMEPVNKGSCTDACTERTSPLISASLSRLHAEEGSPVGGGVEGEEQSLSPEQQHLKQLIASTLADKMKELQVGEL